MRILITNDDGIHAPGLSVLEAIARDLSDDVWIVAPEVEQSGKSRAVTLTEPVRVRQADVRRWGVTGTPTDCVLIAIQKLMKSTRPDLVLSGVNNGQNMAHDTSMSGTVAAALIGTEMGIPSIALSQAKNFRGPGSLNWETPQQWGREVIHQLVEDGWPDHVTMNVNFPDRDPGDVAGIQHTRQGRRDRMVIETHTRTDLRGNDYVWIAYNGKLSDPPAGTDLRAIYDGYISITPLHADLTSDPGLEVLKANGRVKQ
ncbi:MAG: 5'/3'-nucleotidase SurE [Pseudomonadota bacterium]